MMSEHKPQKPGPAEERLKINETDWERAVRKAMQRPKPEGGWPVMMDRCPQCGETVPHTAMPIETLEDESKVQPMVCQNAQCRHTWAKPVE